MHTLKGEVDIAFSLLRGLRKPPPEQKVPESAPPKSIAFVDFEYWKISLEKSYHLAPNLLGWRDEIQRLYNVTDIRFYGDFSQPALEKEIPRIREVSYQIIYTRNTSSYYRKDFTDFILLDGIYQTILFNDIFNTYILFTGDGHFCPIVSCLRDKCHKNVIVYGIRGSISKGLRQACTSLVELPAEEDVDLKYERMVLENLEYLERYGKGAKPTFWKTVDVVSQRNIVERELIQSALSRLLAKGYIEEKDLHMGMKRTIRGLAVDWAKLESDKIWPPKP